MKVEALTAKAFCTHNKNNSDKQHSDFSLKQSQPVDSTALGFVCTIWHNEKHTLPRGLVRTLVLRLGIPPTSLEVIHMEFRVRYLCAQTTCCVYSAHRMGRKEPCWGPTSGLTRLKLPARLGQALDDHRS